MASSGQKNDNDVTMAEKHELTADGDEQRHIFSLILVLHNLGKQEYRRIGLLYNKVLAPSIDRPDASDIGSVDGEEGQDRQVIRIV
jgi:hypothetical protein